MYIRSNILALNSSNHMRTNNNNKAKTIEKLSSGFRINRAADNAADLVISEKMRGQIRGLDMAAKNAQDGISLIQTAEGAINEVHSMLHRMNELAVQAANGTLMASDRVKINEEIQQINQEIGSIANNTEFNRIKILQGENRIGTTNKITWTKIDSGSDNHLYDIAWNGSLYLAVGYSGGTLASEDGINWYVPHIPVTDTNLNSINVVNGNFLITEGRHILITPDGVDRISYGSVPEELRHDRYFNANFVGGMYIAVGDDGKIAIKDNPFDGTRIWNEANSGTTKQLYGIASNGEEYVVVGKDGTILKSTDALNWKTLNSNTTSDLRSVNWINGRYITMGAGGTVLTSQDGDIWTNSSIALTRHTIKNLLYFDEEYIAIDQAGDIFRSKDCVNWEAGERIGVVPSITGIIWDGTSYTAVAYGGKISRGIIERTFTSEKQKINVHIGANTGQSLLLELPDVRPEILGINNITVSSAKDANIAIETIKNAIEKVSSERARLGAYHNRLEHAKNSILNYTENLTASESRIRDVDIAKEMMSFTKNNILTQTSQAMLAQANTISQNVLRLLN